MLAPGAPRGGGASAWCPPETAAYQRPRSAGLGGDYLGDVYEPGAFDPTDFAQDIIWADGLFVRWPQKLT